MTAHKTNPVILVINGDEENIWTRFAESEWSNRQCSQETRDNGCEDCPESMYFGHDTFGHDDAGANFSELRKLGSARLAAHV